MKDAGPLNLVVNIWKKKNVNNLKEIPADLLNIYRIEFYTNEKLQIKQVKKKFKTFVNLLVCPAH